MHYQLSYIFARDVRPAPQRARPLLVLAMLHSLTPLGLRAQGAPSQAAWVTIGAGLGTITDFPGTTGLPLGPAGVVEGSYQRGRNLLSLRVVGTFPIDLGDGFADYSLLFGRATALNRHPHGALSIGLGLARRTSGSSRRNLVPGVSGAARLAVRSRVVGLGLYAFAHGGRDSFAGLALALNLGRLR